MKRPFIKTALLVLLGISVLILLSGCNASDDPEVIRKITEFNYEEYSLTYEFLPEDTIFISEKQDEMTRWESYILSKNGKYYKTTPVFYSTLEQTMIYDNYQWYSFGDSNEEISWTELIPVQEYLEPSIVVSDLLSDDVSIYISEEKHYISSEVFEIDGELYMNPQSSKEIQMIEDLSYVKRVERYSDTEEDSEVIREPYWRLSLSDNTSIVVENLPNEIVSAFESEISVFI